MIMTADKDLMNGDMDTKKMTITSAEKLKLPRITQTPYSPLANTPPEQPPNPNLNTSP